MKKREDSFTCGIADGHFGKSKPRKEVDPSEKVVLDGCSHALPDDSDSWFGAGASGLFAGGAERLERGTFRGLGGHGKGFGALHDAFRQPRGRGQGRDAHDSRREPASGGNGRFADAESAGASGGADGGRTDVECGASGCSGGRNGRVCAVCDDVYARPDADARRRERAGNGDGGNERRFAFLPRKPADCAVRSGYFNQSERIGRAERTGDGWRDADLYGGNRQRGHGGKECAGRTDSACRRGA